MAQPVKPKGSIRFFKQWTGDTVLTAIVGSLVEATVISFNSNGLVTEPPALVALVAETLVLLVCLKSFSGRTKYLKIFYFKKKRSAKRLLVRGIQITHECVTL